MSGEPRAFSGSYYEDAFLSPVFGSVFETGIGTASGLYRGVMGKAMFSAPTLDGIKEFGQSLLPYSWKDPGAVVAALPAFPLKVAGKGMAAVGQAAGYVAGGAANLAGRAALGVGGAVGRAAWASLPYLPSIAMGAGAKVAELGLRGAEAAIETGAEIWNSPLMKETTHWSGKLGMKQWGFLAETGIMATAAMGGAAKGIFDVWNSHRLGYVDAGQLEGTVTPAKNYGQVTERSDPTWYNNDADGKLVFALNKLRRG